MSGICDTCMTAGACEIRRDGRKLCAAYERNSNYNRLFGTPERAARTLRKNGKSIPACYECLVRDECVNLPEESECLMDDHDALLEWLKGENE